MRNVQFRLSEAFFLILKCQGTKKVLIFLFHSLNYVSWVSSCYEDPVFFYFMETVSATQANLPKINEISRIGKREY